jgi:putative ABC transport system permease protein
MSALSLALPLMLLRGNRLRLLPAVLGVALGVSAVNAIDLVNSSVLRAFSSAIESVAGRAALQVTAKDGGAVPRRIVPAIGAVPGVELAVPVVGLTAFTSGAGAEPVVIFGIDVANHAKVYDPESARTLAPEEVADFLAQPNAVVLPRSFAARRGLVVGDRLELETVDGPYGFTVHKLIEPTGMAALLGGNLVLMPLVTAEAFFTRPGFVSRIDVVVRPEVDRARVERAIAVILPRGFQVSATLAHRMGLSRATRPIQAVLWGSALIGMVLGFLVAFGRLAAEFEARAWQMGVLRAVGLRTAVVQRELLKAGLLLGIAGVLLGIPLGVGLGHLLLPVVAMSAAVNANLPPPPAELIVDPRTLWLSALVGMTAAVGAVLLPAWRAARVSVAATVSRSGIERAPAATGWILCGATLGAAAVAIGLQAWTRSPAWGVIATALVIVATAALARPLLLWLRHPLTGLGRLAGPAGPFVSAALLHDQGRTTLTVATLAVGLGCVVWMLTLRESFERTLAATLEATMRADLVVTSADLGSGWIPEPVDEIVVRRLVAVPGVAAAAGNRLLDTPYRGRTVAINAFDPSYFDDPDFGRPPLVGPRAADVWAALARGDGAIVSTSFARGFGVRVGDLITLDTPRGPLALRVLAITVAFVSTEGTIEMSRDLLRRYWGNAEVSRVWVRTAFGVDPDGVRHALANSDRSSPPLLVLPSGEMRDRLLSHVRRAFAPLGVARALVLLVALAGIADTLAAGVTRRRRVMGTMRAVGVRRRYLRRIVLIEGLGLGAVGLLNACVAGLVLAMLWVHSTLPGLFGWDVFLHFPPAPVAMLVLMTLGVCLVAGIGPARRAARLAPAAVLRCE